MLQCPYAIFHQSYDLAYHAMTRPGRLRLCCRDRTWDITSVRRFSNEHYEMKGVAHSHSFPVSHPIIIVGLQDNFETPTTKAYLSELDIEWAECQDFNPVLRPMSQPESFIRLTKMKGKRCLQNTITKPRVYRTHFGGC